MAKVKLKERFLTGPLRPQGMIGLLLFVFGVAALLSVSGRVSVPRPERIVLDEKAAPELEQQQVELVVVDAQGQERVLPQEIALPVSEGSQPEALRLTAVVSELKTVLAESEVWPEGLELPTVFLVTRFNRRVAVLDFAMEGRLKVTLEQEMQTLESIRKTLRRNGVDEVEVLVNGQAAKTFLGHVALDAALE